jgi:PIN domain nuclease of toxin-antitoxin system
MARILPDTHLLLWTKIEPRRLSMAARKIFDDPENDLFFSAVSLWEISVKKSLRRENFDVDPPYFYRTLIDDGYIELKISSVVSFGVLTLPHIHKDPFDRLLIAQAAFEDCLLLTADPTIAKYPGQIRLV